MVEGVEWVRSVPMRNGNLPAQKIAVVVHRVRSVPMRNGNSTNCT
ncbi:protein of unknown function [Kyrpidia spormannii]|uniref:Uncharacterized protein n=1 Tax=Kyrpidia spormannii TaxID=2055160 RepID=A0A6F9EGR4_9BACL|nr:protein of unknown function [Kyrpidia spormannii]